MKFSEYTIKNIEETLRALNASKKGLTEKEVGDRLKNYGLNEIKIKEKKLFDIFLKQFKSPFFYLLFIAAIFSFLLAETINGLLILFFVLINVSLGFFQETKAEKTASALKKYIPLKTRVLRQNNEKVIEQKFLVPGDIVLLEAGNIIPADLRLLKTQDFLVDESILSGESVPVPKTSQVLSEETKEIFKAQNIVFTGTSVVSGEAEGVVIGTGKNTVIGEITKLAGETVRESVYEKNLLDFSRLILRIVIITIVFVFLANLAIKGRTTFFEFLIFSIALIISILPEALPLVVTFAFSQGALRLAKKRVVVKRLSAIEDLGNVEVLCTDKTGTLAENKLILKEIRSPEPEKCLLYALLTSAYMKEKIESTLNPFDFAIFQKAPPEIKHSFKKFKMISEIPFDPFRKRNSALLRDESGNQILITKGEPETILKISSKFIDDTSREEIVRNIEKEGKEGKRILAIAFREFSEPLLLERGDEKDLTFLGFFSFQDPLKETAKEAIQMAKKLGLQIKILTGDSKEVAGQIAKEIGLIKDPQDVILGEDLEVLSEEHFEKKAQEFSVFARISPQTKFKIVSTLQKKFEVGFLGEGINDAPALKVANIAIAVKEGADISREVSDIILLEKDLRVIVDGVKEGRHIFVNINKYIKSTLSSNFGNFYSIAFISFLIPFLPMLPVQILLVNLLTDFPLITIASDRVDIQELRKPKFYQLQNVIVLIIFLAFVSTIFDFFFFGIFHNVKPQLLQTLWFIESVVTEILLIFSIRTPGFFLKAKIPSLPLIILSSFATAVAILLPFTNFGRSFFHFVSPPLSALLILFSLVLVYFLVSEIIKLIYFRKFLNRLEK